MRVLLRAGLLIDDHGDEPVRSPLIEIGEIPASAASGCAAVTIALRETACVFSTRQAVWFVLKA